MKYHSGKTWLTAGSLQQPGAIMKSRLNTLVRQCHVLSYRFDDSAAMCNKYKLLLFKIVTWWLSYNTVKVVISFQFQKFILVRHEGVVLYKRLISFPPYRAHLKLSPKLLYDAIHIFIIWKRFLYCFYWRICFNISTMFMHGFIFMHFMYNICDMQWCADFPKFLKFRWSV